MDAKTARNAAIGCFGLAAVIGLVAITGGFGNSKPTPTAPPQAHQPTVARNGMQIAVGPQWGAPVMFLGRMCPFWDSPASGVEWQTSTDGKNWAPGLVNEYTHVRFRAPVSTIITFTLQDPPPPGQQCKRVR